MPYSWVPAEMFMQHRDVKIYFVYRNDMADEIVRTYRYGWHEDCSDSGNDTFDVRDLAERLPESAGIDMPRLHAGDEQEIRKAIRAAIDAGILTQDGPADEDGTEQAAVQQQASVRGDTT